MGRPKVAPYKKINLAPPTDVVEQMNAVAKALGMSKVELWELAARRLLRTLTVPGAKAKKGSKK